MNLSDFSLNNNLEKKVNVPIFLVSDKNYLNYAFATIQSIIEHANSNYIYHIFLLNTDNANTLDIEDLKNQCLKHENFSFKSIDIIELMKINDKNFNNTIDKNSHFTPAIYGRIFIPQILSFFDKVIYTDIDIIYQRDIAELMFVDIKDKMLAAVPEVATEVPRFTNDAKTNRRISILNLNENQSYINSGLLLFNIKKCLEYNFSEKVISFINNNKLKFPDQDAINAICKDSIFYLPQAWNCTTDNSKFIAYINKLPNNNKAYKLLEEWVLMSKNNKTCFHYMGGSKPWETYSNFKAYLFWFYFIKSPKYIEYLTKMIANQSSLEINSMQSTKQFNYSAFGIPLGHSTISATKKEFSLGNFTILKTTINKDKEKKYILGVRVLTKKTKIIS